MLSDHETAQLLQCSLFKNLPLADLKAVFQRFPPHLHHLAPRTIFFQRGDPYESLMVILEGTVEAEIPGPNGRMLLVEEIHAPEPLASSILFSPRKRLPVTVTTRTSITALALGPALVFHLCQTHRPFLEALMYDMGRRTAFLAEKLRMTQFTNTRVKIAAWILDLMAEQGSLTVVNPCSKQKLAEIFGIARTSLLRVWAEMEAEGIMASQGKKIRVLQEAKLRHLRNSGTVF